MNICMMTNTFTPHVGGVARSVLTFTETFRRLGHRVLVVAPTFPECNGEPEEDVIRLPAIQQFNGSDFSVRLPLSAGFNEQLAAFQPNMVHSHHPFLLGDTALRIAADKHAPVVFTHHTLYEEYTHYVPFDSPRLKQFIVDLSTEYANLCDGVIAPSESIARLITSRGVRVPVEVVPTGIDPELFQSGNRARFRKQHGISRQAFVIGHVGRLAPEKNLDFLGRAVAAVLHQSPRACFLAVGKGPCQEAIRARFESEGLSARLLMPGQLTGQDLADAYAAMNLFAFSSLSETQGLVLAEAMAAGLPVVALEASGSREVVRDGENGFLLPTAAPVAAFSDALIALGKHAALRRRMQTAARRTAALFAKERCALKSLSFYNWIRNQTRKERRQLAADPWHALQHKIRMEWELLSQKARCAMHALLTEPDPEELARDRAV